MASIYKRKDGKGWRAVIRIKGHPTVCFHEDRKEKVKDKAAEIERQIKDGEFNFDRHKKLHTFNELVDRHALDGILEHHRSAEDTKWHLTYWKSRLGAYALVHINAELLGKERRYLLETPTPKGKKRTSSTVNRYMASLSSLLSYAAQNLSWISENHALRLKKLKENPSRHRVLSEEEITRLLKASRQSKSPYLYCIVLIALTTGARQGEILNLEWRHVNFDNQIAFIKETKNGSPRSIHLCKPVVEELKQLYKDRNPQKSLVFASKTVFGRIDIKKAWQQALQRAGITHCRAHDLRHTFCTYAAAKGASNLQLKTATGHKTLNILSQYTHMDVAVTKQFSDQISDQILKGESP